MMVPRRVAIPLMQQPVKEELERMVKLGMVKLRVLADPSGHTGRTSDNFHHPIWTLLCPPPTLRHHLRPRTFSATNVGPPERTGRSRMHDGGCACPWADDGRA